MQTLLQVLNEEPKTRLRQRSDLSRDLEVIALKCLEKDPGRRYTTALELAADLQRYLSGEPIRARPVGHFERARKWARRRPALAGLIAAIVGLTAVSFITVF